MVKDNRDQHKVSSIDVHTTSKFKSIFAPFFFGGGGGGALQNTVERTVNNGQDPCRVHDKRKISLFTHR